MTVGQGRWDTMLSDSFVDRFVRMFEQLLNAPRTAMALGLALSALKQSPLRSILTMIGVIIGVASVILVFGLGEAAKRSIENQIAMMGPNMAMIAPATGGRVGASRLGLADAEAISRSVPGVVRTVPQLLAYSTVVGPSGNAFAKVIGTEESYFDAGALVLDQGRLVDQNDARRRERVAVLGYSVARKVFGAEPAIGQNVQINRVSFTVIGVLAETGAALVETADEAIIVPLTTARDRLRGTASGRPDALDFLSVQFRSNDALASGKERVAMLLRDRFGTPDEEPDPFSMITTEEFARQSQSILAVLQAGLMAVAAVSLIVGSIGVTNIILVGVSERVSEIGLRMAIGATPADIQHQFLIESFVLCLLGGVIGTAIGVIITAGLSSLLGWPFGVSLLHIAIACFFAGLVGLAAGTWPARRAAQLSPIDALRRL